MITPGYSWRLDLDVTFNGERPADWPEWIVRMHVWDDTGPVFTLTNDAGVTFEAVEDLPDATGSVVIPVITMTKAQAEQLRGRKLIHYLIDLQAPAGDAEDYFAGNLVLAYSPPAGMLQ